MLRNIRDCTSSMNGSSSSTRKFGRFNGACRLVCPFTAGAEAGAETGAETERAGSAENLEVVAETLLMRAQSSAKRRSPAAHDLPRHRTRKGCQALPKLPACSCP